MDTIKKIQLFRGYSFHVSLLSFIIIVYLGALSAGLYALDQFLNLTDLNWQISMIILNLLLFLLILFFLPNTLTGLGFYSHKFAVGYGGLLGTIIVIGILLVNRSLYLSFSFITFSISGSYFSFLVLIIAQEPYESLLSIKDKEDSLQINATHKFLWRREFKVRYELKKGSKIYVSRNIVSFNIIWVYEQKFHNLFFVEEGIKTDLILIPIWFKGIRTYNLLSQIFPMKQVIFESTTLFKNGRIYEPFQVLKVESFNKSDKIISRVVIPKIRITSYIIIELILRFGFVSIIMILLSLIIYSMFIKANHFLTYITALIFLALFLYIFIMAIKAFKEIILSRLTYLFGTSFFYQSQNQLEIKFQWIFSVVFQLPIEFETMSERNKQFMVWRLGDNSKAITLRVR